MIRFLVCLILFVASVTTPSIGISAETPAGADKSGVKSFPKLDPALLAAILSGQGVNPTTLENGQSSLYGYDPGRRCADDLACKANCSEDIAFQNFPVLCNGKQVSCKVIRGRTKDCTDQDQTRCRDLQRTISEKERDYTKGLSNAGLDQNKMFACITAMNNINPADPTTAYQMCPQLAVKPLQEQKKTADDLDKQSKDIQKDIEKIQDDIQKENVDISEKIQKLQEQIEDQEREAEKIHQDTVEELDRISDEEVKKSAREFEAKQTEIKQQQDKFKIDAAFSKADANVNLEEIRASCVKDASARANENGKSFQSLDQSQDNGVGTGQLSIAFKARAAKYQSGKLKSAAPAGVCSGLGYCLALYDTYYSECLARPGGYQKEVANVRLSLAKNNKLRKLELQKSEAQLEQLQKQLADVQTKINNERKNKIARAETAYINTQKKIQSLQKQIYSLQTQTAQKLQVLQTRLAQKTFEKQQKDAEFALNYVDPKIAKALGSVIGDNKDVVEAISAYSALGSTKQQISQVCCSADAITSNQQYCQQQLGIRVPPNVFTGGAQ